MTELSGEVLETLWDDGELALYRGRRHGKPVLVLAPVAEQPAPASLGRLEQEYALADELESAWAARPLALVRHRGRPALVLEDGGSPLDRVAGQPLEPARFLPVAIGLAAALGRVHRRGLIHKDIKPRNVLVDAAGGVRLTGFGIASRLPRERQAPGPPEVIAGSLAYMAPEQTGRMNRSIDSRSDLYSLGITFYQLLTGALPFAASDPLGWVHCHIARQPAPPDQVAPVPPSLSAIVMKLLAKTAEERYQTAAGVEADLRRCLADWQQRGRIGEFPPATDDASDRFLIPEKLYGREREIDALLAAFDGVVADGTAELVLVSGYSGIGKSSVVNELHKVLVLPRGLFASGKFDQYKRGIPYATLAQALQGLVHQILAKSEADAAVWREALREAVGPNGQLIINLIPEVEFIIGRQPPVPDLPPQDAHNRFRMVFRRFLAVFATPEHPLALFLDDLQWLDTATLDLLEHLLTEPEVRHLLLVGAYRDNEVGPGHPLLRTLDAIRRTGASVREIVLAPLALDDVGRLVADSLHCGLERARPLAQLVHQKADGNPFFAIQFFSALADDGLLGFDPCAKAWTFDLARIRAKGFTDNVADLMVRKLCRLPAATRDALGRLACLGNVAEIGTLTLVHEQPAEAIQAALFEAARAGLVFRHDGAYAFAHDRVQEAAYAAIPDSERAAAHLKIGRVLAARTAPAELEEKIFEIVNQLDRGVALIDSPAERDRVAELNLLAGRRAMASTAHASALSYLSAGRALLSDDAWERRYPLIFALELLCAECEFLTGELAAAQQRLELLSRRAENLVDSAAVTRLRATIFTTFDHGLAVEACLAYLDRVGVSWSAHPSADEVSGEFDRVWEQLGSRTIEELVELPTMTDPVSRASLDVLTSLQAPARFTDENLTLLIAGRCANLSLRHGNSDASCLGYVWFGQALGKRFGDYQSGLRFGQLGLDLVERRGLDGFKARVWVVFGHSICPWTSHVRTGIGWLRRAFDTAQRTGDLTFAAFSSNSLITLQLVAGYPLAEVEQEAQDALAFVQRARFGLVADTLAAPLMLIRSLRGLTPEFSSFTDRGELDESRFETYLDQHPRLAFAACAWWLRKLQARVHAGEWGAAVAAAARAERLLFTVQSHAEGAEFHFYRALALAAHFDAVPADERPEHLRTLASDSRQLEAWARSAPENFADRADLVAAEIARLEGRDLEAMRLYERAIAAAREHGFIHNEGLAHEVAARFWAARGFETIARTYLLNARYCYLRWGADGKVRQLERLHLHLRGQPGPPPSVATIGAPVGQLDVGAVVKASQAVSGEIELGRLVDTLMRIAIEHAGAERGLLVLLGDGTPRIEAEARLDRNTVVVTRRQEPVTPAVLPESLLHTVIRTQRSLILDDASAQDPFAADAYVRRKRARSVLCLPLMEQAELTGVLYLENNLATHVFTPARIAVLELLASQAAISLENARLYNDLQEREARLRESEQRFRDYAETASDWLWETGPDHRLIRLSEEHAAAIGISPALRIGAARWEFATDLEEEPEKWRRHLATLEAHEPFHGFRYRTARGDGSVFHVAISGKPVFDREGRFLGYRGAASDVTAAVRAEQAEDRLREAQAELAHVARVTMLGELSASIAHEVNQPIAAVVSNAAAGLRWLRREPPELDEVRDVLARITRDAHRAGEVIGRVRALANKTDARTAPLEINDVITEVIPLVRRELLGNRVSLRTELAPALPAVLADRVQLQQVIINLVINGIEAMHAVADRPRELVIRSDQDGADVLVTVEDCGVGISADNADRLFKAFFTTKPGGMGMGLPICLSIIEAHGGKLSAANNAGPGAVIRFTLPSHRTDTSQPGAGS